MGKGVAGTTGTADVTRPSCHQQLNRRHTVRPVRATHQLSIPPSRLCAVHMQLNHTPPSDPCVSHQRNHSPPAGYVLRCQLKASSYLKRTPSQRVRPHHAAWWRCVELEPRVFLVEDDRGDGERNDNRGEE